MWSPAGSPVTDVTTITAIGSVTIAADRAESATFEVVADCNQGSS
jgi:hypothetical protein